MKKLFQIPKNSKIYVLGEEWTFRGVDGRYVKWIDHNGEFKTCYSPNDEVLKNKNGDYILN